MWRYILVGLAWLAVTAVVANVAYEVGELRGYAQGVESQVFTTSTLSSRVDMLNRDVTRYEDALLSIEKIVGSAMEYRDHE